MTEPSDGRHRQAEPSRSGWVATEWGAGTTRELRERVMRDASTVSWPEGRELRITADRRTVRRRVAFGGAAVVVLVVLGLVWSSGPRWPDPRPRPADEAPGRSAELLRADDVGPGYRINGWGSYTSSDDRVSEWPPSWLDDCPALRQQPATGFRGHLGGHSVNVIPPLGSLAASIDELLVRMVDDNAARAVLDESRQLTETCASFTVGNRLRYTMTGMPGTVAGDESVRVDVTEEGYNAATGERVGAPAQDVYLFVRVGRVVLLLRPSKPVDVDWLHGVARAAVNRLCAGSREC